MFLESMGAPRVPGSEDRKRGGGARAVPRLGNGSYDVHALSLSCMPTKVQLFFQYKGRR